MCVGGGGARGVAPRSSLRRADPAFALLLLLLLLLVSTFLPSFSLTHTCRYLIVENGALAGVGAHSYSEGTATGGSEDTGAATKDL